MKAECRLLKAVPAIAACAIAAGLVAAVPGFGTGSVPPASSTSTDRDSVRVVRADELVRMGREQARAAGADTSAKSAKLSYFTTVNTETVVPGGDLLYEIRCPAKRQPLTGGVLSTSAGLAITNSSRLSPDADRPTLSGAWYEGVVNLTSTSLSWKPFLVCVSS